MLLAQKQNKNFLSLSAMNKVAKVLGVAPIQIYEGELCLSRVSLF